MTSGDIDERFILLNREAELVAGLLSGGLADFQKITRGDSFYYESFYSLSLGFERLLKLILIVKKHNTNVKSFGHNINSLFTELQIRFPKDSIESVLVNFLSEFASKNRYSIPDILSGGDLLKHESEPIHKFESTVTKKILEKHPLKNIVVPPEFNFAETISLLHITEDFGVTTDANQILMIGEKRRHIAKYSTMYVGRIMQPAIKLLEDMGGAKFGNPYFDEHFTYLRGNDSYFKSHKEFRRR